MISIKGVNKYFNRGKSNEIHVINDVSLELEERGITAIFGKSGCGKTTLLNVIGGLDGFESGDITIDGKSIGKRTDSLRNAYIGYIFQNYNLNKEESCFENVADALRLCGMKDEGEIETRVNAALRCVGMDKYAKRTPDTLSGGQMQRIAIARAIVKNPRIILADEPTGNLDEANTVMIMNLLKAISKDHLVLLVTHEAKLVDYYCDTVIELSDGKVESIRRNSSADGYTARDKNDIWLGELEETVISDGNAEIKYYGDAPASPLKLRIVNSGGKLYLTVDSAGVRVIDETSEIKLREGVYEEQKAASDAAAAIDMSALPRVEGERYGALYNFRSSFRSGYRANFRTKRRGGKVLRRCMSLFAAVMVFMSAVFGSAIGDIITAKKAYNHNTFYVYTPNGEVSQKINEAVGKADTGVDYIRLTGNYPTGDGWANFKPGAFETFSDWSTDLRTNAVYLSLTLADGAPLLAGRNTELAPEEVLISGRVADAFIEKSQLGYIKEYEDLIGLITPIFKVGGKNPRIAGVVDTAEPAIYLGDMAMAKYVRNSISPSSTVASSDIGFDIKDGEATLAIRNRYTDMKYPEIGETVMIQGKSFTVTDIRERFWGYEDYLKNRGIVKLTVDEYMIDKISRENPGITPDTQEYYEAMDKFYREDYYEYYGYYYSELDSFLEDLYFFENQMIELWLYFEKGIEEVKYTYVPDDVYRAEMFRMKNGRYPTADELAVFEYPYAYEKVQEYVMLYQDEFWSQNQNMIFGYDTTYVVSDNDYIALSKRIGETHPTATSLYFYYDSTPYGMAKDVSIDLDYGYIGYGGFAYTLIHSSDPELTAAWIEQNFAGLETNTYMSPIVTPDDIYEDLTVDTREKTLTGLITMAVMLVLMSICMYFIMRSALMNRIKEVGICRAIGVSKRNLKFKFFVEAFVLTALTVLVSYAISSAFLAVCMGMSPLMTEIFYYPVWLAGGVLAILIVISLFFGTLPISSLLRKTPSEILAKYDI